MTKPAEGGQAINLAALWVPVMPDTSHFGDEMQKAGEEGKRRLEQGFQSGSSPEELGSSFGSKLMGSINKEMKDFELPLGLGGMFEKLNGEVDKHSQKLRGEASQALREYSAEYDKLTAAQQRLTEATQKYDNAKAGGLAAHSTIPLLQEQLRAQKDLTEAQGSASSSYENLTKKNANLKDSFKETAGGGELVAGIMGGLVVAGMQAATGAIDTMIEAVGEGFKEGIETVKEFADKMIELGETYEHIEVQIQEFSTTSGEALEEMTSHAQKVFGDLDVAGEDTGKTMAQFASILDAEPSPALDTLTKHVEELQGRFGTLKAQNIASIFHDFQTPLEDTDTALASLLQSARSSGQDFGTFTQALSGTASDTLKEAGLNIQQAGAFTADLLKMGEPGGRVMTGLASAMKEFGKEGLSFGDGMKLAAEKLGELGNSAAGEDLAEKLFGTRNWVAARDAVQNYIDIVNQGPDAFNASADSVDEFLEHTKTLENEWEEVKHKAEEAFLPMGDAALGLVSKGLDGLVAFIKSHMTEIENAVKVGGEYFIHFAADVEQLAQGTLAFMAPVAEAVQAFIQGNLIEFGHFAEVVGEFVSYIPGMKDIGNGMKEAGQASADMGNQLGKINVGDKMKDLSKWLGEHKINVDDATKSWDNLADHVYDAMNKSNEAVDGFHGVGASATMGLGVGSGGTVGWSGGAPPSAGAAPSAAPGGAPAGGSGGTGLYQDSAGKWHAYDTWWEGVIQAESGGNIAPQGNPTHFGLFQFSQSTWDAIASQVNPAWVGKNPGTAPADVQAQIAQQNYNQNTGNLAGQWVNPFVQAHPGGTTGSVSGGGSPTATPQIAPSATTVPDMSAGLNLSTIPVAAQKYANDCIDASARIILSHSGINLSEDELMKIITPGTNIDTQAAGLNQLDPAGAFKALPGSGGSQQAMFNAIKASIDNGTGSILNVAPGSSLAGHTFAPGHFIAATGYNPDGSINVSDTAGGKTYSVSAADAYQATMGRGIVAGTGSGPGAVAGAIPGGKDGGLYPGLPGQYGGNGVYGGETADQQYSAAKAVREAQERADDLDQDIANQQKHIADIKTQIAQGSTPKLGLLGQPLVQTPEEQAADAKRRKSLNDELDSATQALARSQRERADQDGEISNAQRKQQESMYRKPKDAKGSGGDKSAEGLGQGLLEGIGEELGFGDLFGKSPLDWGIVKLAEGVFKYVNDLGDALFGGQGTAGGAPGSTQGLGGGGIAGGLASGVLGGLGLKLPGVGSISASPNVIRGTPASGQGLGAPPGPPVVMQDNSITVQAGVSDKTVLGPVKAQQDSVNSQAFQYTGGFPAP